MEKEIRNLLINEKKLSPESVDKISTFNVEEFIDTVLKLGKEDNKHIKIKEIQKNLKTRYVGREIYIFKKVMSTNTVAKFLAEKGVKNGTVVISEKQTAGKGRSGKKWLSPSGGVWLSIILNPYIDQSKSSLITLATGVAVAKTIKSFGVEKVQIKWPNDILIDGKKICGVLTEAIAKFNSIEHLIVGVGINVNVDLKEFPKEQKIKSTSLNKILGKEVDETKVIARLLNEFEKIGDMFLEGRFNDILTEWRHLSYTIGKNAEIIPPYGNSYPGYVVGINKEGALIVEKLDGTLKKVISGECKIID